MASQAPDPAEEAVQAVHERYQREAVEDLNLCPFARRSREQGRVHRPLVYASEPEPAAAAARRLREISREHADVEVVLLTFVLPREAEHAWHDVDAFEEVVKAVRAAYGEHTRPRYYMVGFHPRPRMSDGRRKPTAESLVPALRRSPDPVIQCIRADLLDDLRKQAQAAADARFMAEMAKLGPEFKILAQQAIQSDYELSSDIARHNFASVGAGEGRERLERCIADILAARAKL
ncbi:MAG: DUF1415 family protein [Myxococcales bacterium]|nr:DUF1415 family protein [Myxococcales bacterium]